MSEMIDLAGSYSVTLSDGSRYTATLPGTLDTNSIGFPDSCAQSWHPDVDLGNAADANTGLSVPGVITTRFTRKHTYTGKAVFTRLFSLDEETEKALACGEKRAFLHLERSRELSCMLDGKLLAPYQEGTLSTEAVYELTEALSASSSHEHTLSLAVDNSYPSLPASAITYSSAATDETQTNWNGIVGSILLELTPCTYISAVRVYPSDTSLTVHADVDTKLPGTVSVTVESTALASAVTKTFTVCGGRSSLRFYALDILPQAKKWDEGEGKLQTLTVRVATESHTSAVSPSSKTVRFGLRTFKNEHGRCTLNGRPVFLRSEANCAVFPETGHLPMDEKSWEAIFKTYASYGINHVRFHSHCPPEAAFSAADKLGMLVQPELSNWDPKTAFESREAVSYYTLELVSILRSYANHPSFVMLTLGNELHYSDERAGHVASLLQLAKNADSTRLYANASNPFYGHNGPDSDSDFYTSAVYKGEKLRGTGAGMSGYINNSEPTTKTTYEKPLSTMREEESSAGKLPIPVISFEVGQYEVLPDFNEIALFNGVTLPENLRSVQKRVQEAGFADDWEKRVSASGELSLRCYREEIEAALRTSNPAAENSLSGISLLGLQDFPGQGTALVGMLNSHLKPKPYSFAAPERFKQFCAPVTILAALESYTYRTTDTIPVRAQVAQYGKTPLTGETVITLTSADGSIVATKTLIAVTAPQGSLTELGSTTLSLSGAKAGACTLSLAFAGVTTSYSIWLYDEVPAIRAESSPYQAVSIATTKEEALDFLSQGKRVYLEPAATEEQFPASMETCFSTDFWSVGTFAFQSGYMGILTNPQHPIFRSFPTAYHADWQWWQATHKSRAFMLPGQYPLLIEAMDSYARLRRCALLAEFRMNGGLLMISGMGLLEKQDHITCRALLHGILSYMSGNDFKPEKELDKTALSAIIQA